jgi:ribokinase
VFLQVPLYPPPGGDSLARQVVVQSGGSAANTALAAARLGIEAWMVGRVGKDEWARIALSPLEAGGVHLEAVRQAGGEATGLTFLPVTPDGERTMFTYRGANARLDPLDVDQAILRGAWGLHLSGYAFLEPPQSLAAWRAVSLAQELGIRVSLDIGVEPARAVRDGLWRLLPALHLVVLGEQEACRVAGRAAGGVDDLETALRLLLDRGVGSIGLKLGGRGCRLVTRELDLTLPGFHVAVVDTTGAGDAFCAGMLFGTLHGHPLPVCGVLANALGALTAARWGAGSALPTAQETTRFLKEQANRHPELAEWILQAVQAIEPVGEEK